jgi:ribosome maturation factor RimP
MGRGIQPFFFGRGTLEQAAQDRSLNWQAAVEKTVAGLGYELVECERGSQGLLRVTIDRLSGQAYATEGESVTVDDCEKVTRQLQLVLEVEACDYKRLEVSSPGLDRPLKTAEHYARFAGERIELTLKLPFQGRKKYAGVLMAGEGGEGWALQLVAPEPPAGSKAARAAKKRVTPAAADEPPAQVLNFTLDEVREARLVPVVDFKGRRGRAPEPEAAAQESGGHEE